MDATLLSNALERMSMEDIFKAMKDLQLKNQALQEENHRLLTVPSVPNTTRSPVLSPDSSGAAAGSSAYDSASNTKTPSLFDNKESQKELEYCAMKMVIFRHIWFERKGLFGIGLESACRKLNAVTLTNAIYTGMKRPSPDRILVLRLVLKLYKYLPSVFYPLADVTITGEYHWMHKIMKEVRSLRWSSFLNWFRNLAPDIFDSSLPRECFKKGFDRHKDPDCQCLLGFKSVGVYDRHPPCLFAGNFKSGATIFRTIYGVRILMCLLWGTTALDDQKIITKGTYADLWHVNEVNSVAIAFAAIVTRYLLLGDTDFAAVGKKSSINYMADFEYYVEHLEDQLKKGTTSIHTTSLNEEEEDFWHKIEALDKEPDFDSDDPAPPITPVVSVRTPSAISSQVNLPAMPAMQVTNDSEAQAKGKKGKKGSNKAVPMVTRVTHGRGGQGGVPAETEAPVPQAMRQKRGQKGQQESSNGQGLPVVGANTIARAPVTMPHVAPIQGTIAGIDVEEGPGGDEDDDNDDDMEDEDE
ncbi:hypothetical protein EDD18DRAFT_1361966 [Armillaria luteobubalina]|uniref:Uncharacterized protein n=1 Tax=Armillaria luteobubalina TaxID=153913 RepID=A0AA39PH12_9AGAR|nr:hypothetical protein EDD18DRAFT_1361966 [Armillaria luteobubalina]